MGLNDEVPVECLDNDLLVLLGDGVLGAVEVPWPLGVGGLFLELVLGVVLAPPSLLLVTLMLLLMMAGLGTC
jgi:hypothetical protein